jgi:hypothetical protein
MFTAKISPEIDMEAPLLTAPVTIQLAKTTQIHKSWKVSRNYVNAADVERGDVCLDIY